MARNVVVAVFVLGVVGLMLGGLVPGLHNATTNDVKQTTVLDQEDAQEINDKFLLNATSVSLNGSNATVRVTDLQSQERNSTTVNVSNSSSVVVGGENVTVTLEDVRSSSTAVVTSRYASLYGMDEGPRFVFENAALLLVIVALAMVIVVPAVVIDI
jgi:hypothetical protein